MQLQSTDKAKEPNMSRERDELLGQDCIPSSELMAESLGPRNKRAVQTSVRM